MSRNFVESIDSNMLLVRWVRFLVASNYLLQNLYEYSQWISRWKIVIEEKRVKIEMSNTTERFEIRTYGYHQRSRSVRVGGRSMGLGESRAPVMPLKSIKWYNKSFSRKYEINQFSRSTYITRD